MNPRPEPYPEDRLRAATVRSRLMLEIASELVGVEDFDPKQVQILFRPQGAREWGLAMFASDALSAVPEVAAGRVQFAILNPATMARRAVAGLHPFAEPVPLRAIATVPSYDQFGVAVAERLGVTTMAELAAVEGPLRISLRGARPDHSIHLYVEDVLGAIGLSREEVEARGGAFLYQSGIPHQGARAEAIRAGEVDVIIDEGIYNWVDLAIESGFRFLSVPDPVLDDLGPLGYRRGLVAADDYELLAEDVTTLDFSGFLVYTHADVPDDTVARFCSAMIERSDRIGWQGGPSLPIEHMVSDAVDAPLPIPFHPAAEWFWRDRGFLSPP